MNQLNYLNSRNRYQFIPRTLIFINHKNKYLLIRKKAKNSFGFNKLNGVGGHIEKGEEPYEAAKREIFEETGLRVLNLELVGILFIDTNENPGIQVFVFSGSLIQGKIKSSEEGHLQWMTPIEIENDPDVIRDVPELISLCQNYKKGSQPLFYKYIYNKSGELRIDIIKF